MGRDGPASRGRRRLDRTPPSRVPRCGRSESLGCRGAGAPPRSPRPGPRSVPRPRRPRARSSTRARGECAFRPTRERLLDRAVVAELGPPSPPARETRRGRFRHGSAERSRALSGLTSEPYANEWRRAQHVPHPSLRPVSPWDASQALARGQSLHSAQCGDGHLEPAIANPGYELIDVRSRPPPRGRTPMPPRRRRRRGRRTRSSPASRIRPTPRGRRSRAARRSDRAARPASPR